MRLFLLFLFAAVLGAVEVSATVHQITDGDTISVTLSDQSELKVRLLYVDTPESSTNSHGIAKPEGKAAADFLRSALPIGSQVELWNPNSSLVRDRYGRALAVVWKHETMFVGAGGEAGQYIQVTKNINSAIIRAGWSPYWRKYGHSPDKKMDQALTDAQAEAQEAKSGAWATDSTYMINKANETTAPKY